MSNSLLTLHGRDFLSLSDLDRGELLAVLELAARIKAGEWRERPLSGKHVAMLETALRTNASVAQATMAFVELSQQKAA